MSGFGATQIDALLPRRVFRETGNAGRVQLVHDLLRERSNGDLSAMRPRSLHRRVGVLLELRRKQGQGVAPAVLAEHFKQSEDRSRAFAYSLEAAEAAIDAYAFNNAIAHVKDAQELCDLIDRAVESLTARGSTTVGVACGVLGFVRLQASDYDGARAAFERSCYERLLCQIDALHDCD